MAGLALLQLQVSVDESWLDHLIIGVCFVFVLGIGAILRNRIRSSEGFPLSGRSLPGRVTGLAFLSAIEIPGMGNGAARYGLMAFGCVAPDLGYVSPCRPTRRQGSTWKDHRATP